MPDLRTEFLEVSDALELGNPAIVEKDFWVVDLLAQLVLLQSDTHMMVFSGGTALAKSSVKIMRMSEDVDIKLIPTSGFDSLSRSAKKTARKKILKEIEAQLVSSGHFEVIDCIKLNEYRYIELEIQYPQHFKIDPACAQLSNWS